jgi:membrane protein YqaA with SNARE-associated domain
VRVTDLLFLFAWSFAASTILPLSSEIPLIFTVRRAGGWGVPVLVATVGNYLGACTTYWLARTAMDSVARPSSRLERATAVVARYGAPALLLSWVPIVGDAIVAVAGAAHIGFGAFSLWTIVGKAARYAAIGWLAARV